MSRPCGHRPFSRCKLTAPLKSRLQALRPRRRPDGAGSRVHLLWSRQFGVVRIGPGPRPVSSLVGEKPIKQRSNPAFYRPGGAFAGRGAGARPPAPRRPRGRSRYKAIKPLLKKKLRRTGRGSRFVRFGPFITNLIPDRGGAGGRERARAGSAPRPHAPAAARQGQATAEDEPRRRPRGAARPSSRFSLARSRRSEPARTRRTGRPDA